MAKRSSLEDTIISWFPKETIVKNSRRLLKSKQEIDIYFPKYKLGVEINGGIWHSEAMGKGIYHHRDKFIAARKCGINLLTFADIEVKYHPDIVKGMIEREMGLSYNLLYQFTKFCFPNNSQIEQFFKDNSLTVLNNGIDLICLEDKKGLAAILRFEDLGHRVVVIDYFERNGVHIINGISSICDKLREFYPDKPMFIKLHNDHGYLYYKTLHSNGYGELCLTEPTFYYLKGAKKYLCTTTENVDGFTKVYDSGDVIFVPLSQSKEDNLTAFDKALETPT